ncbi:hypothetical protein L7F22_068668 [Adiantum nelumboides]|nr:hypothetical protein [Adiantum nelumboides]
MTMDPDFSSLATRALKLINDVRQTAVEIAVNRADFLMMAYYLVELRPFLEELNKQQEFLSGKLALPSLQHFTHVIESIHTFTKVCASRSRIYLLCHSIDLVQNMNKLIKELAESLSAVFDEIREVSSSCERLACEVHARLESLSFQPDPGHNRLSQEIRTLANSKRDESIDIDEQQRYCTILLQKIASHLNVHFSEASTLQLELQKDLTVAESEGREDNIHELKKLCAVLCSPEAAVDRRNLSISEPSSPRGVHVWEVPSSFFCPITKDIMREPVMLEQGHTYEKAAILEWFQRGYRTCPDTGKELESLELIPNVTLQEAMDEYFTKMHTQQLLNSLLELKEESTPAGIEAGINVIKSILRKNPGYIRLLVPLGGLGPLISVLKLSPPQIREWILRILYKIALLGDSYKLSIVEENAIPSFIRILSKNPGDKGGPLQLLWELSKCEAASNAILSERGAVLIVASACNLCQNDQKVLADKLLDNLCLFDKSIIVEAAKSSVFGPLISGLNSGDEELKLKLAVAISDSLELNEHNSSVLVKAGVIPPLLDLFQHGTFESKQAAGKALQQLSTTDANIPFFANEGAIPVLVKLLGASVPQLKVDALAILSNLATDVRVAAEIDQEGTVTHHLGLLLGDPLMQEYSVKTLRCMAKDSKTVRKSLSNLIPMIYRLLREKGLSSSCRGSILGLLCFLAEDRETRNALLTSADMVKFLIDLMDKSATAEDKVVVLNLLAGLSKIEEMKSKMVTESQLLGLCLDYLKLHINHKMQEAAAVILSQLCDPALTQPSMLVALARQGLVSNLVEIFSSTVSTERAKYYAITSLGHLSKCTPQLTERQSLLKQLLAWLGMTKFKICVVHSGKCSIKGTLCIVEAGAIPLLINVIKEGGLQSAEQSLDVLKTLVEHKESQSRGVDFLVKNEIIPLLVSIVGKSSLATEKAASMMEIIFRFKRYRDERFSKAATTSLARILGTGSADARRAASIALMHLKKVNRESNYDPFTSTTTS